MVTLKEILDTVLMKYPHAFTNSQIISMINDIQRRLFRTMYKPDTATVYDILADNPFYPIDYSPENIIDVVVNGKEYPNQNIKYDSLGRYWYVVDDNTIGIYPTPTEDITSGLTVFRYRDPALLTINDLGIEPEFDNAWHMIIVYRVCRELAEIAQDGGMVQNFTTDSNSIETEYKRSKQARPHRIHDIYGAGRGAI